MGISVQPYCCGDFRLWVNPFCLVELVKALPGNGEWAPSGTDWTAQQQQFNTLIYLPNDEVLLPPETVDNYPDWQATIMPAFQMVAGQSAAAHQGFFTQPYFFTAVTDLQGGCLDIDGVGGKVYHIIQEVYENPTGVNHWFSIRRRNLDGSQVERIFDFPLGSTGAGDLDTVYPIAMRVEPKLGRLFLMYQIPDTLGNDDTTFLSCDLEDPSDVTKQIILGMQDGVSSSGGAHDGSDGPFGANDPNGEFNGVYVGSMIAVHTGNVDPAPPCPYAGRFFYTLHGAHERNEPNYWTKIFMPAKGTTPAPDGSTPGTELYRTQSIAASSNLPALFGVHGLEIDYTNNYLWGDFSQGDPYIETSAFSVAHFIAYLDLNNVAAGITWFPVMQPGSVGGTLWSINGLQYDHAGQRIYYSAAVWLNSPGEPAHDPWYWCWMGSLDLTGGDHKFLFVNRKWPGPVPPDAMSENTLSYVGDVDPTHYYLNADGSESWRDEVLFYCNPPGEQGGPVIRAPLPSLASSFPGFVGFKLMNGFIAMDEFA